MAEVGVKRALMGARLTWSLRCRPSAVCACAPAELPYGWDEAVDDYIGVYYIEYARPPVLSLRKRSRHRAKRILPAHHFCNARSHNTRTTYLDPPWDENVMKQVATLTAFLEQSRAQTEVRSSDNVPRPLRDGLGCVLLTSASRPPWTFLILPCS